MSNQFERIRNAHLTDHYQCSNCGGGLVEVGDIVRCVNRCHPAGFVARSAVAQARHNELTAADEQRTIDLLRDLAAGDDFGRKPAQAAARGLAGLFADEP